MIDIKNKILPRLLLGIIVGASGIALLPISASAATTVKCQDGTEVSVAIYNDATTACASHGGLASASDSTASSTVKCTDTNDIGDCAKSTSFTYGACGTSNVGIRCLVVEILSFLSIGVGIAVVGGITVGGIMYSTSAGNPSKTQTGIKIIGNAILGLVLYLLLFAILQFLIPGGVIGA